MAIHGFGGMPARNYSERRLRRSPLADVASMMRSYYYVAYDGFFTTRHVAKEDVKNLLPYTGIWIHYMTGFFIKAYLETVEHSDFIPKSKDDLKIMMQTYLLEKALVALDYELLNRPDKVLIPLTMIRNILNDSNYF